MQEPGMPFVPVPPPIEMPAPFFPETTSGGTNTGGSGWLRGYAREANARLDVGELHGTNGGGFRPGTSGFSGYKAAMAVLGTMRPNR